MPAITVTLPDGSPLELDDGATGADAAAAIGPGLAKAALAIKADGELRDLAAPLADGERDRDRHRPQPRRPRAPAPRRGARAGDGGRRALARDQGLDRARRSTAASTTTSSSPRAMRPSEADLERIEEKMREHVAADEPFERTDVTDRRGARALPRRGAALQGRADRRPGRERGRRDRLALPQRAVHWTSAAARTRRRPGASGRSS